MQLKNIEPAISYTYGDQPTTSPKCGNRTTVYETTGLPVVQRHTCLSANCRYTFIQVAEEDNHPYPCLHSKVVEFDQFKIWIIKLFPNAQKL